MTPFVERLGHGAQHLHLLRAVLEARKGAAEVAAGTDERRNPGRIQWRGLLGGHKGLPFQLGGAVEARQLAAGAHLAALEGVARALGQHILKEGRLRPAQPLSGANDLL